MLKGRPGHYINIRPSQMYDMDTRNSEMKITIILVLVSCKFVMSLKYEFRGLNFQFPTMTET